MATIKYARCCWTSLWSAWLRAANQRMQFNSSFGPPLRSVFESEATFEQLRQGITHQGAGDNSSFTPNFQKSAEVWPTIPTLHYARFCPSCGESNVTHLSVLLLRPSTIQRSKHGGQYPMGASVPTGPCKLGRSQKGFDEFRQGIHGEVDQNGPIQPGKPAGPDVSRQISFVLSSCPNCQTANLLDCQIAGLLDCRIVKLPECQFAGLPDCGFSRLPDCQPT